MPRRTDKKFCGVSVAWGVCDIELVAHPDSSRNYLGNLIESLADEFEEDVPIPPNELARLLKREKELEREEELKAHKAKSPIKRFFAILGFN